mmetsp:Transcript_2561/g.8297  ORF Transcript_2561/g.8297 Transcript_2561/m.8297 type:complete len:277 (+) Transcript_2561:316-1146(+)
MRTNKALIMRVVQSTFVTREACRRTAHVGYARRARPHDDCTLRNSRVLHVNMCFTTAASAAKLDNTTRPITICIEGNISAGKSTFLQEVLKFSDHHMRGNVCLVPEPVHLWQSVERASDRTSTINVLDEFYKDPSGLAYKFQHYVFMTRFIEETRSRQGNFDLRVMERSVFSDKNVFTAALYENGWLSDLDLSLYHAWYSPMLKEFPSLTPDGFVYLRASPTTCLRRLKKRARGEETGVDATYLTSLHSKHESWLLPEDAGEQYLLFLRNLLDSVY